MQTVSSCFVMKDFLVFYQTEETSVCDVKTSCTIRTADFDIVEC